jgi:hypothetical protein
MGNELIALICLFGMVGLFMVGLVLWFILTVCSLTKKSESFDEKKNQQRR